MNTHCLFNKNTPLPTRLYTHLGGAMYPFVAIGVYLSRRRCTPIASPVYTYIPHRYTPMTS